MAFTVSRRELLVAGNDDMFRSTIHDSLGFAGRLQEARNGLGESIGLSGPAYSILIAIDHLSRHGQIGVSAVSSHLHLSGAFVTIEVNKLIKSGLVEKRPDPSDGRRVILKISVRGSALLSSLTALQQEVNDTIFGGLSEEEFKQLSLIMSKLVKGVDEALALLRLRAQQREQA